MYDYREECGGDVGKQKKKKDDSVKKTTAALLLEKLDEVPEAPEGKRYLNVWFESPREPKPVRFPRRLLPQFPLLETLVSEGMIGKRDPNNIDLSEVDAGIADDIRYWLPVFVDILARKRYVQSALLKETGAMRALDYLGFKFDPLRRSHRMLWEQSFRPEDMDQRYAWEFLPFFESIRTLTFEHMQTRYGENYVAMAQFLLKYHRPTTVPKMLVEVPESILSRKDIPAVAKEIARTMPYWASYDSFIFKQLASDVVDGYTKAVPELQKMWPLGAWRVLESTDRADEGKKAIIVFLRLEPYGRQYNVWQETEDLVLDRIAGRCHGSIESHCRKKVVA